MHEYYPLLLAGGIIGLISVVLIIAYATVKDKKQTMGFERHMNDGEITRRLMAYAKPYALRFVFVGIVMLFTIAFDIVSPLIIGGIEDMIVTDFKLNKLFIMVGMYAGILIVSMVGAYVQAIVLQKTGQRIISHLREDLFTHIESLSHEQMNEIPIGKLVTRITNDTNAISLMFTTLLVNLVKNFFVLTGVLVAMFFLNYELTLMVLCIAPFIVLFTVIFRKFSRRAYRKIKDRTTDINTYLSENLSGIKITQIFNREEAKEREFDKRSNLLGRAKQEQILVFGIFRPLVYMLYITTVMCLFYLGGKGYLDGTTFLGQTLTASKNTILRMSRECGKHVELVDCLVEGAFGLNQDEFRARMAESIEKIADDVDVVLFAQGSMAYCEEYIAEKFGKIVLSSPRFGAAELKKALVKKGTVK